MRTGGGFLLWVCRAHSKLPVMDPSPPSVSPVPWWLTPHLAGNERGRWQELGHWGTGMGMHGSTRERPVDSPADPSSRKVMILEMLRLEAEQPGETNTRLCRATQLGEKAAGRPSPELALQCPSVRKVLKASAFLFSFVFFSSFSPFFFFFLNLKYLRAEVQTKKTLSNSHASQWPLQAKIILHGLF